MFRVLMFVLRIPPVRWLALQFAVAARASLEEQSSRLQGESRQAMLAGMFHGMGVDPRIGAGISAALEDGLIICAGISPVNDRPYSFVAVAPGLEHARRREVYDAVTSEIPGWIARTINAPGRE